jgi:hypothetical protein
MAPTYNDGDWLLFRNISIPAIPAIPAITSIGSKVSGKASRLIGKVILIQRNSTIGSDFVQVKRAIRIEALLGKSELGIWVEGDNKTHSTDSRTWGPITSSEVRGVLLLRYRKGVAQSTGL